LAGGFKLVVNGEETGVIPYNIDSLALEKTINDLQSVGAVSVKTDYQTNFLVPG
jgi:hypothetical protein